MLLVFYGAGVGYSLLNLLVRLVPVGIGGARCRVYWRWLPVWLLLVGPLVWFTARIVVALRHLLEATGVVLLLLGPLVLMGLAYLFMGLGGYLVAGLGVLALIAVLWCPESSPGDVIDRWLSSVASTPVAQTLWERLGPWLVPPVSDE